MTKRQIGPPLALVTITLATFGLAKWHPFMPSTAAAPGVAGDGTRGRQVFVVTCSGCHGHDATGGIGPSLHGIGLTATQVEAIVASGRGVMPAGLVKGQEAADVAAYVASLAS
jgi:mono/diheme cytochrome c family protein